MCEHHGKFIRIAVNGKKVFITCAECGKAMPNYKSIVTYKGSAVESVSIMAIGKGGEA